MLCLKKAARCRSSHPQRVLRYDTAELETSPPPRRAESDGGTNCHRSRAEANTAWPTEAAKQNSPAEGLSRLIGALHLFRELLGKARSAIPCTALGACKGMLFRIGTGR